MKTKKIIKYLNDLFDIKNIKDSSLNGLQVDSDNKEIKTITFAVDFSLPLVAHAKKNKSQMIIVHHGIIWKGLKDITGLSYKYISSLIKNNLSLYALHLPLDLHPKLGHNIELCKLLSLKKIKPFGKYQDTFIGFSGELNKTESRKNIEKKLQKLLKTKTTSLFFGPEKIKKIGIVSGGAADLALESQETELDLFISGETSHSLYNQIKDSSINAIFCGHYATETLGLKKLALHLKEKFNISYTWFDNPTGL